MDMDKKYEGVLPAAPEALRTTKAPVQNTKRINAFLIKWNGYISGMV